MLPHEIVHEVIDTVLDQGALTKDEILKTWAMDERQYLDLQMMVAMWPGRPITSGPARGGGFVAKKNAGRPVADADGDQFVMRESWERPAAERLAELLTHAQLEDSLGTLLQSVRQVRKFRTGEDRRGSKHELAAALVIQRGVDLFGNKKVRSFVAAACAVTSPGSWVPGKATAVAFVRSTGFPPEIAGVPKAESLPDFEYLEPRLGLRPLWPFQEEVKGKLLQTLNDQGGRGILTLPTGAGKTRVAVECLRDWLNQQYAGPHAGAPGGTVLWLAHTEELCEQALACFKQVWEDASSARPLHLIRFWGRYTQDLLKHGFDGQHFLTHPSVLISTPQRASGLLAMQAREPVDVVDDLIRTVGALVIDEAQRAAAPSYRTVIDALKSSNPDVSVVGLTATPFRKEYEDDPEEGTRDLSTLFHGNLIEPLETLGMSPRLALQERGVLARPDFQPIETQTRITLPNGTNVKSFAPEDAGNIDQILAKKTDRPQRRLAVFDQLLRVARDDGNSILYFGPSVNDAECMCYLLRSEGVVASAISSKTSPASRRVIVERFKQGQIRVLCNCEVLTTGFDAPQVTHVVMARPTVSRVLYEQILGRGLRGPEFGGTQTCVVMDCIDNYPGERPPLGYESFRRIWEEETSIAEPLTRDEAPELAAHVG